MRRRQSFDERLQRALANAKAMHGYFPEDTPKKIAFHDQQGGLARAIEQGFRNIREIDEERGAGRGDKWSATYNVRKWAEIAEIEERTAAAYRELLNDR